MTFNDNADVSRNTARRRGPGRNAAVIGGGAGGLGIIAIIILNLLTGGDIGSLFTGGGDSPPQSNESGESIENCDTGADANENDACRLAAGTLAINQFWEAELPDYRSPELIVVDGSTSSACGTASNATGPFYCPPEETVYMDPTFFELLRSQFGAQGGELAQLYVLAHEYGHHVQNIIGLLDRYSDRGSGPDSNGVRIELQADCFAGAWVGEMSKQLDPNGVPYLQPATQEQRADALNAAATVGDDHIQSQSGQVNPESWTHGSSEQRERWFTNGYEDGVEACDTFSVSGGDL